MNNFLLFLSASFFNPFVLNINLPIKTIFSVCSSLFLGWKETCHITVCFASFFAFSHISSVQFSLSVVSDSLRPHESQHARPPVHHQLRSSLRLTSIESVMPSSHLIPYRPLLLLPPIPPSIRVFSNESALHMRWPKYWSFSFSIIPSKEIPGLISFRMDWLDLLAVQGTLKSLL